MSDKIGEESRQQKLMRQAFDKAVTEWRHESRGCPLDEELSAYFEGSLPLKRRLAIWWHTRVCTLCRVDLLTLREALLEFNSMPPNEVPATVQKLTGKRPNSSQWLPNIRQLAVAVTIVLLSCQLYKSYVDNQDKLRRQVRVDIENGKVNAARLLAQMNRAESAELMDTARQIRVAHLVAYGETRPYPYFAQWNEPNASTIAEGLQKFPELDSAYQDYLKQWGDIYLTLGNTLFQAGKIEEAVEVFEYLQKTNPHNKSIMKSIMFSIGELEKFRNNHSKAIAVYEEILTLDPTDPRPLHYAGFSEYRLGNYDKALEYYERALRIHPGYAKVDFNIANLFKRQGKTDLYNEYLQRALELSLEAYSKEGDNNPRISFTLAIIFTEKQDLDKALDYLERAIRKERTYIVRSMGEHYFEVFRNPNSQYHEKFMAILDRYKPPAQDNYGTDLDGAFDPSIFWE